MKLADGIYEACPVCDGAGEAQAPDEAFECPACAGEGLVPHDCEARR